MGLNILNSIQTLFNRHHIGFKSINSDIDDPRGIIVIMPIENQSVNFNFLYQYGVRSFTPKSVNNAGVQEIWLYINY